MKNYDGPTSGIPGLVTAMGVGCEIKWTAKDKGSYMEWVDVVGKKDLLVKPCSGEFSKFGVGVKPRWRNGHLCIGNTRAAELVIKTYFREKPHWAKSLRVYYRDGMKDNLSCDNVRFKLDYEAGMPQLERREDQEVWKELEKGILISSLGGFLVDGVRVFPVALQGNGKAVTYDSDDLRNRPTSSRTVWVRVKLRNKWYYVQDLILLAFYPGKEMIRVNFDYSENFYNSFRPTTKFDKKGKTVSGRLYKLAL